MPLVDQVLGSCSESEFGISRNFLFRQGSDMSHDLSNLRELCTSIRELIEAMRTKVRVRRSGVQNVGYDS